MALDYAWCLEIAFVVALVIVAVACSVGTVHGPGIALDIAFELGYCLWFSYCI